MKIKINSENVGKIQAAIDAAQTRARTRTIDAQTVLDAASEVRETLDIPKCSMRGVVACVDPHAQSFPGAYKGVPESTQFRIDFNAKGEAFLSNVTRERVSSPGQRVYIYHTDDSRRAVIERLTNWA